MMATDDDDLLETTPVPPPSRRRKSDNVVSMTAAKNRSSGTRRRPPGNESSDAPREWPVTPLGVCGRLYFYLDAAGQLQPMRPNDFNRLGIKGLWGAKNHELEKHFPRHRMNGAVIGVNYDEAASAHIKAAGECGVWNPLGHVRGAGSWRGDEGELILHFGDEIMSCSAQGGSFSCEPGKSGRYVYPACPKRPKPYPDAVEPSEIAPFFETLQTWNWRRGEIDARLSIGWIAASLIAGAIEWRPVIWITGGRGTGKSTLQKLQELVLGGAMVAVSDASAAGIWQKLGHSTLPVVLDEVEAEEDNKRNHALLKLARHAASGGMVLRGGADHGAAEFVLRSCVQFSSILLPPLSPQDKSRMAVLELSELKKGGRPPVLDVRMCSLIGAKIQRRLIDGWPRWRTTLDAYRSALSHAGDSARGADVFGTLLAAADLLLNDGPPSLEFVKEIVSEIGVNTRAEAQDDARDEERCLHHLVTQSIPIDGTGTRRAVAEWVVLAAGLAEEGDLNSTPDVTAEALKVLRRYGLKLQTVNGEKYLGVANSHAELAKLFQGTIWACRPGSDGGWRQSLRRMPGSRASKVLWFSRVSGRATLVPLSEFISNKPTEDQVTE